MPTNSEALSAKSLLHISSCILSDTPCVSIVKSILVTLLDSTSCFQCSSTGFTCFLPWLSVVLVCFSKRE